METLSCHSNQSSYLTKIKNITFVEGKVLSKYARMDILKNGSLLYYYFRAERGGKVVFYGFDFRYSHQAPITACMTCLTGMSLLPLRGHCNAPAIGRGLG